MAEAERQDEVAVVKDMFLKEDRDGIRGCRRYNEKNQSILLV